MITQSIRQNLQADKRGWLRHLTWAAPLFFLVKGLLWLALPLFFALSGME